MNAVVELIKQNLNRHPHHEQYFVIVETIERNKHTYPDICIESCKSLIEGVSKTILLNLDATKTRENIDKDDVGPLFKGAVKILGEKSDDFEPDFASKFGGMMKSLAEIRNKRSEISHGRAAPKTLYSSAHLAASMTQMTAGIVAYLLEHYYRLPASQGELDYASKDLTAYNLWLDESVEDFPIEKACYSEILFEKDYAAYQSIYEDEYLPSIEPEDAEKTAEEPEPEPIEPAEPKEDVEVLSSDFDDNAFWTPEAEGELRDFSSTKELDYEKLKQIVSDTISFERYPRSEDLFEAYEGTLRRLKEWLDVKEEIMNDLVPLIESLKSDAGIG